MSRRPHLGDRIDDWELQDTLGSGGNGAVFRAQRTSEPPVALKILYERATKDERYQRFRREVNFLSRTDLPDGVLPLLEAHAPERLPPGRYPWLAMPIASPLATELGAEPEVDAVIDALASVAETLAALADRQIHHRDIKPDNILVYEGRPVLGDFGLVVYPEASPLTKAGRKVGPYGYIAPEMIDRPDAADPGPADVYSLAKTLWVLATGQKRPLEGHYEVGVPQISLQMNTGHHRAYLLDAVLDRCTRFVPSERLTMAELAHELRHWQAPPTAKRDILDLTDIIAELIATAAHQIPTADQTQFEQANADEVAIHFGEVLESVYQSVPVMSRYDQQRGPTDGIPFQEYGFLGVGYSSSRMVRRSSADTPERLQLISIGGAEVLPNGKLRINAGHFLADASLGTGPVWQRHEDVIVGSPSQQAATGELAEGLATNTRSALRALLDRINWYRSGGTFAPADRDTNDAE